MATRFSQLRRIGWRRTAAVLAGGLLIACTEMAQALADAKRTETAIKTEIGVDSTVSAHDVDGHVTVRAKLKAAPPASVGDVDEKVTKIVLKTFHCRVGRVDVSY
jgi:hypothetical protein